MFDRVRDEDRADAQFLEVGVVAAQVVIDDAVERESVENGDDAIVAANGVHPQQARVEHPPCSVAMKLLRRIVGEHAREIAAFPSRGVEIEEAGEQIVERLRGRRFDANVTGAFESTAVVAKLFLEVG